MTSGISGYHLASIKPITQMMIFVFLAIFSMGLCGQSSVNYSYVIDSLYAVFDEPGKPGCAICIVKNGEIVYKKCFGLADLEHKIPISDNTQFALASASKQFTGLGLTKLIHQKRLNPDISLSAYLPNENVLWDSVKTRHLIHHTSGIWDWPYLFIASGHTFNDVITHQGIYEIIKSQPALNFKPGNAFQYASSNYVLLGEIITVVTDTSYFDWITQNVFRPAGMLNTVFQRNYSDLIPNRAQGYLVENNQYLRTSNNICPQGTGSVFSTLTDMTIWLKYVLSEFALRNPEIVNMFAVDTLNDGNVAPYSFGLMKRGKNCYWHDGVFQGFRNMTIFYPVQNVGLVLLSNSGSDHILRSAFSVAKMFLKDSVPVMELEDFRKQFAAKSENKPANTKSTYHQNLNDFIGVFLNTELLLAYQVYEENDSLFVKNSVERILLTPIEGERDAFHSSKFLLGDFFFNRNENGLIQALSLKQRRGNVVKFKKIDAGE